MGYGTREDTQKWREKKKLKKYGFQGTIAPGAHPPRDLGGGGEGFYSYLGTWPMNLDLLGGKPRMRLLAKAGSVDGLACVGKRLRKIIFPTLPQLAKGEVSLFFLHQCYLATMLMLPNINAVKVFVKWGEGRKTQGRRISCASSCPHFSCLQY